LIVVESLILSKSFLVMTTASFWLFFSVFYLMDLNSSIVMKPAEVLTPVGNLPALEAVALDPPTLEPF